MAQKFLDKILSRIGLKSTEDSKNRVPTHFTDDEMAQQKAEQTIEDKLTGTERYLKKQQQKVDDRSGVDAYLIKQKNKEVSEKIKKSSEKPVETAKEAQLKPELQPKLEPQKIITNKVEKTTVIASEKTPLKSPVRVEAVISTPEKKPKKKASAMVELNVKVEKQKMVTKTKKPFKSSIKSKPKSKGATSINRCQAATTKGTRCRRKGNLKNIAKTIEGKNYEFIACNQHNNDKFTPFAKFVTPQGE
ncbi:MAG: hypothetical protein KAG06_06565 [Methylococcales bacterium]|nr:hypothetical protein [Methylococcales bacterium]